jgi:hypothetical protein
MVRFQRFAEVLAATGSSIPKLLGEQRQLRQELGGAELTGTDVQATKERLDAVSNALASAARQRVAASEGLLGMAGDLRAARASAAGELAAVARSALADFNAKWNRCCAELGRLVAEAGVLGAALRTQVATPPPYTAALSADGMRIQIIFAGPLEADNVGLPPEVAGITSRLDAADSALALVGAVGQTREWDQRYIALQRTRSAAMPVMSGIYTVVRAFDHLGTRYEVGQLVSTDIMSHGTLHRRWLARELRAVEDSATVAA